MSKGDLTCHQKWRKITPKVGLKSPKRVHRAWCAPKVLPRATEIWIFAAIMVPGWPRRVLIRAHWLPKGIPRASCWWFWVPKVSSRGLFWHPKDTFWPSRWYPWASKARLRHMFDFMLLFGWLFAVFYRHFRPWQASNNSRAWHDMLEVCVLFEKVDLQKTPVITI